MYNTFDNFIDRQLFSIAAQTRTANDCAFIAFMQDYKESVKFESNL